MLGKGWDFLEMIKGARDLFHGGFNAGPLKNVFGGWLGVMGNKGLIMILICILAFYMIFKYWKESPRVYHKGI